MLRRNTLVITRLHRVVLYAASLTSAIVVISQLFEINSENISIMKLTWIFFLGSISQRIIETWYVSFLISTKHIGENLKQSIQISHRCTCNMSIYYSSCVCTFTDACTSIVLLKPEICDYIDYFSHINYFMKTVVMFAFNN